MSRYQISLISEGFKNKKDISPLNFLYSIDVKVSKAKLVWIFFLQFIRAWNLLSVLLEFPYISRAHKIIKKDVQETSWWKSLPLKSRIFISNQSDRTKMWKFAGACVCVCVEGRGSILDLKQRTCTLNDAEKSYKSLYVRSRNIFLWSNVIWGRIR